MARLHAQRPVDLDNQRVIKPRAVPVLVDRSQLDPAMDAVVEDLLQDAQQFRETYVYFEMLFQSVTTYTINGQITRHEIRFSQWIDPEGGIKVWVVYTLDPALNVVDVVVYV